MKRFSLTILLLLVGVIGVAQINVIPRPASVVEHAGAYILRTPCTIGYPVGDTILSRAADFCAARLAGRVAVAGGSKGAIVFVRQAMPAEGYRLVVTKKGVEIQANDYAGAVYGVQTLLQLQSGAGIPLVEITDAPRFGYRGMHLDCSRHFFPLDSVKRYLDYMAMHKLNRFHWHLTDDEGWRIESKRYPELNQKASWRVDRRGQPWSGRQPIDRAAGETPTYGGFYTHQEIRELLAYAQERAIQVIPEVETPGHSSAVFAAYPELSCLGVAQEAPPGGYFPTDQASCYCAGNEQVFKFLDGVLEEVIELFPDAPYIHIGGDEVDKRFWKNCPKCAERIKSEGLKDYEELQRYFIGRIDKIVRSKGKRIIGWDEILEGGLVPWATVMSWRGEQFGIEAARAGNDVVMSPNTYLYFDYYQNDPAFEPEALGSLLSLARVYSYDPAPATMEPATAAHILGAQANIWCEYLPTWSDVERMALPRMSALAEVVWTPQKERNWDDFARRIEVQKRRFKRMGANFHRQGSHVVHFDTRTEGHTFLVSLFAEPYRAKIHYTIDGTTPTLDSPLYNEPLSVEDVVTIRAVLEEANGALSPQVSERTLGRHKAIGAAIQYKSQPAEAYRGAKGAATLLDGLTGTLRHDDGMMVGFNNRNFDLVVDLQRIDSVRSVGISFLQASGTWIYLPTEVAVSVSIDGTNWVDFGRVASAIDAHTMPTVRKMVELQAAPTQARYIHIVGINPPTGAGLPGAGTINWTFADEIVVR